MLSTRIFWRQASLQCQDTKNYNDGEYRGTGWIQLDTYNKGSNDGKVGLFCRSIFSAVAMVEQYGHMV